MSINAAQYHLLSILDKLILPLNLGHLDAFVAPPNPRIDAPPGAYIWGGSGHEHRETVPRAEPGDLTTGGDKSITHTIDIWLVWFGSVDDPNINLAFPAVIDSVMACLRNTKLIQGAEHVQDPVTGQLSQFLDIGENMDYEQAPVRVTANQAILRFDAQLSCTMEDWFQA